MSGTDLLQNCSLPSGYSVLAPIRAASGVVSALLGIMAICVNVLFKKYRFHLQLMFLYFSMATVVYGIAASLSRVDYSVQNEATVVFCTVAGVLNEYSSWTLVLAVFTVTCNLFMEIVGRANHTRCAQRFWLFLIFAFPLLFINWIPFVEDGYGDSPNWPWCSIRLVDKNCTDIVFGWVIKYTLWYVPVSIIITSALVLYSASVIILLRRRKRREPTYDPAAFKRKKRLENEAISLLVLFLIMFVPNLFSILAGTFDRTRKDVFGLWIIYAFSAPMAPGLVAFGLAVDSQTCLMRRYRMLLRCKHRIVSYPVVPVNEESEGSVSLEKDSITTQWLAPVYNDD